MAALPAALSSAVLFQLLAASAARAAEDNAAYNPAGGSDTVKNIAGVAYIVLLVIFFFRLFSKRAKRAVEQSVREVQEGAAASSSGLPEAAPEAPVGRATPVGALIGAAQAGGLAWVLYLLSTNVDAYFAGQELPDQYTARNITVTLRTVVQGLSYLMTFLFAANFVGLSGLAVQMLLFPGLDDEQERAATAAKKPKDDLPKVSLTDDLDSIRKAFREIERQDGRGS